MFILLNQLQGLHHTNFLKLSIKDLGWQRCSNNNKNMIQAGPQDRKKKAEMTFYHKAEIVQVRLGWLGQVKKQLKRANFLISALSFFIFGLLVSILRTRPIVPSVKNFWLTENEHFPKGQISAEIGFFRNFPDTYTYLLFYKFERLFLGF